jgi:hypothetical protein
MEDTRLSGRVNPYQRIDGIYFRAYVRVMNADKVRELLRAKANGNQAAWAREHGMSPQYVSDVLIGRREPGDTILKALRVERVVMYRNISV